EAQRVRSGCSAVVGGAAQPTGIDPPAGYGGQDPEHGQHRSAHCAHRGRRGVQLVLCGHCSSARLGWRQVRSVFVMNTALACSHLLFFSPSSSSSTTTSSSSALLLVKTTLQSSFCCHIYEQRV